MKNSLAGSLVALALVAVVAGCGATSYTAAASATPTPSASPNVACTFPPGEQVALVYPPPGPVPSPAPLYNEGVIIAAAPNPLPTNWYVYVTTSSFAPTPAPSTTPQPIIGMTLVAPPSPLPTPFSDPGFANETIQYSPNGIFSPGGVWQSYIANTNCFPGVPIPNGTFNS